MKNSINTNKLFLFLAIHLLRHQRFDLVYAIGFCRHTVARYVVQLLLCDTAQYTPWRYHEQNYGGLDTYRYGRRITANGTYFLYGL